MHGPKIFTVHGMRLATNSRDGGKRGHRSHMPNQGSDRIRRSVKRMDNGTMGYPESRRAHAAGGHAFGGLSSIERRTLFGWIDAAQKGGIDTAEDLGARLWPCDCGETVIGVFKSGHMLASWLIVGHQGSWAVASCGDGAVSARMSSLAEALHFVYPQRGTSGGRPANRPPRREDTEGERRRCSA